MGFKQDIKNYIIRKAKYYGYEIMLSSDFKDITRHLSEPPSLLFQVDPQFQSKYQRGIQITHTPHSPKILCSKRESRFYNLLSFHRWVSFNKVPGWQVECGCWKGLSSYILNSQIKEFNPAHDGGGFMIVDSFAGLSEPTEEDSSEYSMSPKIFGSEKYGAPAGSFSCSETDLRHTLSEFPKIEFVKGWIPEVLHTLPDRTYSFVHIDLDLHDPILGGINYFFPRLSSGGLIILDDYGSLSWPGAKKAGDDGAASFHQALIPLSTAQALLIKK